MGSMRTFILCRQNGEKVLLIRILRVSNIFCSTLKEWARSVDIDYCFPVNLESVDQPLFPLYPSDLLRKKPFDMLKWQKNKIYFPNNILWKIYKLIQIIAKINFCTRQVHRCGAGGSYARLSRSRPGWIPVRHKFPGWGFRVFSSPLKQMSGRFRPTRSPNIIWPS